MIAHCPESPVRPVWLTVVWPPSPPSRGAPLTTRREDQDVFSITDAGVALSDDQAGRTRRYLLSMGLRTFCFLAAVIASGWLRWAFVFGAVVLPYVAVVVANAGRENGRRTSGTTLVLRDQAAIGTVGPSEPGPTAGGPARG